MSKPRERAVKEVKADGTIVLMTKAAEKKWRKSIKSDINGRRRLRRETECQKKRQ